MIISRCSCSLYRSKIAVAIMSAICSLALASAAHAVALEQDERINLRMVTPIPNNTPFRVWGSKYYPGDVLSERMTNHLFQRMREVPRLNISTVHGTNPDRWATTGYTPDDLIVQMSLEQANFKKKDTLGTKAMWDVVIRMYVYNAATKRVVYENVVRENDSRNYVFYNDMMESGPIYWDMFAETPYWSAIRHAIDVAFTEVVDGYNGYRIVGRIVAKAERVDGSLSVKKKDRDKLFHITIGREDSLRVGDILSVTRSSSVRTIAPDATEMHFPQVIGRVKVIFVKGQDAVVQVIKESKEGPIELGDAVSAPLYGERSAKYF